MMGLLFIKYTSNMTALFACWPILLIAGPIVNGCALFGWASLLGELGRND